MKSPALQPVTAAERIVLLDVLRGFALLGILLMNIEGFAGPLNAALTGVDPALAGADRWADAFVYFFVQGKFYTLFSLLFGMGFAVMSSRAEGARRPFVPMYLRRSAGLLVIGLAHALLLWSGDILVSYALLSLLLLAFAEAPTRWLPVLGVFVYLLASAWVLLFGAIGTFAQHDANFQHQLSEVAAQWQHALEAQRQAFGAGSYAQATVQRAADLGEALRGLLVNGPTMLGMFLLGAWFLRSGVIAAPERHARLFATLRWVALPVGIALMALSYWISPWMDPARLDIPLSLAWALASVANLLMCLGYLAWVTRWVAQLRWLAPAGRMALSNYLVQSLVCTLLFYGYGAGLFEQLPRVWQLPFALCLFALQILASHVWLRVFRFGPVEWLWRGFTYLQWPPLRRRNGVA